MATQTIRPIQAHGLLGSNHIPTLKGQAADSESWARGAVLALTSNEIVEAGEDATGLLGIAKHKYPISHTEVEPSERVQYIPALPHMVFEGNLSDSGDDSHTLAQTDYMAEYGLNVDSDGNWYVDSAETDDKVRVRVIDFVDPIGDINARVLFVFLSVIDVGSTPVHATVWAAGA